ncbi:MAG: hypothetical protein H7176_09435 [Bdellovibrionales bacterium]|nr:hypothetical protein [Massilia sp.]
MFWIKHPKPFIQRPLAMQVVARRGPALRDLRVLVVETPASHDRDVIHPGPQLAQDVSGSGGD